jgi:hypothetical protein
MKLASLKLQVSLLFSLADMGPGGVAGRWAKSLNHQRVSVQTSKRRMTRQVRDLFSELLGIVHILHHQPAILARRFN